MDSLEKAKRQTQSFDNQENIMKKLRGTEAESQDSYNLFAHMVLVDDKRENFLKISRIKND